MNWGWRRTGGLTLGGLSRTIREKSRTPDLSPNLKHAMKILPSTIVLLLAVGTLWAEEKPFASVLELPSTYVVGGVQGGKWLNSEKAGRKLSGGKTSYRVYNLGGYVGTVTAGKASPDAEVCPDVWLQKVKPEAEGEKVTIGVNAKWDPLPRKATLVKEPGEDLVEYTKGWLREKKLHKAGVKITQVARVDLDGDGTEEVIFSAAEADLEKPEAENYSFVAVRKMVGGKWQTQTLGSSFHAQGGKEVLPEIFSVTGLLDLNGDGKLEVITDSLYYEGGGAYVWQLQGDKLVKVLAVDCGV
ncbi:hypothetical protein BH09VER1_BH09VER1_19690 [soil metagenome]